MKGQSFINELSTLIGFKTGLFLHNSGYVEGILLDVKSDFIIIEINSNVFYIAMEQIQALSKNAKDFIPFPSNINYLNKNNLKEVLSEFKYKWVTINSFYNQPFAGLLSRVTDDYILLISNENQLYIQKSSITNIFNGVIEEEIKKEESNQLTNQVSEDKEINNVPAQSDTEDVQRIQLIPTNEEEKDKLITTRIEIKDSNIDGTKEEINDSECMSIIEESSFVEEKPSIEEIPTDRDTENLEHSYRDFKNGNLWVVRKKYSKFRKNQPLGKNEVLPKKDDMIHSESRDLKTSKIPNDKKRDLVQAENMIIVEETITTPEKPIKKIIKPEIIIPENVRQSHDLQTKMSSNDQNLMLAQQYLALMKHAEKMYQSLRGEN